MCCVPDYLVHDLVLKAGSHFSVIMLFGGGQRRGFDQRECTGDGGALSDRRDDRDTAAMQFHERADQGETDSRPAMLRAKRMRFEPVEDLFKDIRWNSGAAGRSRKTPRHWRLRSASKVMIPPARRKAHGVGEEIEQEAAAPAACRR